MVRGQIDKGKRKRMKVCQIGTGTLQLKIRRGRKTAVQQVPENILRRFKRLILPAGFNEQLLG